MEQHWLCIFARFGYLCDTMFMIHFRISWLIYFMIISQFWEFFQLDSTGRTGSTRFATRRHEAPLKETRKGRFLEVVRRSALGLVAVYNLLPAKTVRTDTVKAFQTNLQELLKERAMKGCLNWLHIFFSRVSMWRHPLKWEALTQRKQYWSREVYFST